MSDVEIVQASLLDHELLANLLEFYVYDFSELLGLDVAADGRFGYKELSLYWSEKGRVAFVIRRSGRPAGLALVRRMDERWDMTEFFVMRAHRRQGVAMQAAKKVWSRLTGEWQVRVRQQNVSALRFWERTIAEFTGQEICPQVTEVDGDVWSVFSFESKA